MGSNDNDIYIMIISASVILLLLVVFIVSFLFIYKNRQLRHQVEMRSVTEKYNEEVLKTQLEIKEQTLKNIAEEIHDNVGQILSLVVLNLSAVELNNATKAAVKIEDSTRLVEKALNDLRNLSKTLDADNIATVGLPAMIRFELDMLEKTGVYNTSLKLSGEERRLNVQQELVVYRVIQEALNNIIKHAKAAVINISLQYSYEKLHIEITDNGVGFDSSGSSGRTVHSYGAGIKNMKKRTALIAGTFDIKSVPSRGTSISMNIPFMNEN